MVGAVAEQSTPELRVVGSIPTRNKYLYGLQIVVSGLSIWAWGLYVYKCTHDTEYILYSVAGKV